MTQIRKEHIKMELNKIIPYEKNNKIHTEKDIKEVIKSIKKNGYIAPICVDEKNILLAGHGRTLALIEMGYAEIECLNRDIDFSFLTE